jgi:hypothetical protein
MVIRSLGGISPFLPKTEAGTINGAASALPTALVVCRMKRRRESRDAVFIRGLGFNYGLDAEIKELTWQLEVIFSTIKQQLGNEGFLAQMDALSRL